MKKAYLIVGDNNFWYSTTGKVTKKELHNIFKEIKDNSKNNLYDEEAYKPNELFAYEITGSLTQIDI